MNFNEIVSDINFLSHSTSASYPIADKTRNVNTAYNYVSHLAWQSSDKWQYADSNATTLDYASASLVHSQRDYELPSTAQRVRRVQVKANDGTWMKIRPIDDADIDLANEEFFGTEGMPLYYDLQGRSIIFYPEPSSAYVTLTNGLEITVDKDVTEFPTTATTTEPGFAKPFHRILSLAASIDFVDDASVKDRLVREREKLERGLMDFYSNRGQELPTKLMPSGRKYWRQYM